MKYRTGKRVRISEDLLISGSFCFTVLLLFFPIVNVVHPLIISMLKVLFGCLFLVGILVKDGQLFCKFMVVLIVVCLYSYYYYYNCWINYTSIGSFMINNILCWLYMEMGVFLFIYSNEQAKKNILRCVIIAMVCTAITSIIILQSYPEAVRGLGNGEKNFTESSKFFYMKNTADWGILYAMAFFLPVLVNLFKRKKKIVYFLCILIIEFCIIKSQITFAVIFSLIFLFFLVFKPLSGQAIMKLVSIFMMSLVVLYNFLDDFFLFIYNMIEDGASEVLARRVYQLYMTFHTGRFFGDAKARMDLYGRSFFTFLKNPLFGLEITDEPMYSSIGLHSQILDMMGATGIFGMLVCVILFFYLFRKLYMRIEDDYTKNYFLLSVLILIIQMFLNPTYYCPEVYLIVFSLPALSRIQKLQD